MYFPGILRPGSGIESGAAAQAPVEPRGAWNAEEMKSETSAQLPNLIEKPSFKGKLAIR